MLESSKILYTLCSTRIFITSCIITTEIAVQVTVFILLNLSVDVKNAFFNYLWKWYFNCTKFKLVKLSTRCKWARWIIVKQKTLTKPEHSRRVVCLQGRYQNFGELALLYPNRQRNASVIVEEPTQLLVVTYDVFQQTLQVYWRFRGQVLITIIVL